MLLRLLRQAHRGEQGQALVLMILAMTLVFMVGVLVVDFGFWFSGRSSVTNATDAATLAASLDLPTDGTAATAKALQYVADNDPDIAPADVSVTFRCIVGDRNNDGRPDNNDILSICPQVASGAFTCDSALKCYANCTFTGSNAKCNTVVVAGSKNVPFAFGSEFGLTGAEAAGFTSAACRGACGAAPTIPLDVVIIIDRTGSMSPTDLTNARNAAKSILLLFDSSIQHVAFGILPRSSTTSTCAAPNAGGLGIVAGSGGTWLPVPLSNDYQNPDGSLNNNSLLVKTINCFQGGGNTDLGDPIKAASDYLQASGRPGVKKGIILMTDGAANQPLSGDTGYLNCTSNAAVGGSPANGDGNGYETNPQNACAAGGGVATDALSGTATSTTCTASGHDRHDFWGYGVSPAGSPVTGIEVQLTASVSPATASTRRLCVQLSWDGGTSWGTAVQTSNLTASLATYTLPKTTSWGHTFLDTEIPNLRVRVTDLSSATTTTYSLDAVTVRIYYGLGRGPCDWAVTQANAAKAAEIEFFTIGYGVDGSTCADETVSSPYENEQTTRLLADMSTQLTLDDGGDGFGGLPGGCLAANQAAIDAENADGDHFLCEARGNQLEPVFRAAAEALASGSRLVKIPF